MKKIALLLSGNIRRLFDKSTPLVTFYIDLIKKQNIDVFIYTDNNDFYYDNIQYLSDNNKDKILGIPTIYERRYHTNIQFINYENSSKIIKENLFNIFNDHLKNLYIEDFDNDQINNIYDKNNIYHNTFMNNIYSDINRKKQLCVNIINCINVIIY